jgi:FkbM family methyltransferase
MNRIILEFFRIIRRSAFSGLWKYINYAYYNPKTVILPINNYDYITVDGYVFQFNDQVFDIQRVNGNPWFEGIRSGDIVLDIGANIGAIAIPLAKVARQVYAVEPIFDDLLNDNMALNRVDNIKILKYALGDKPGNTKIAYGYREGQAISKTFAELKEMCGEKIDFLKCDCEGGEWYIQPRECEGIRELRFEFHIRHNHQKQDLASLEKWCQWLDVNGYEKHISDAKTAPNLRFKRCWLFRASKKAD